MCIKTALIGLALLGLAACASTPNERFAGNVTAAVNAQRPLVIYQFLSAPTLIYYKNANRYRNLAYANRYKIFNKFTAVSFINTAQQPIQHVTFQFAAYNDSYQPVMNQNGQPVVKNLTVHGAIAPGADRTLVNANIVWTIPPGNGLGCIRLTGIHIVYADGSSVAVAAPEVGQYLAPQISNTCGVPPSHQLAGVSRVTTGPSPYIAGVYPAKWMLMHEPLFRQPFVPPSNTQPLCAVGSLLTETCGVALDSSSSQD
ncbi:MAG: hypothetical protein ACYDCJ_13765 [Gammaproteobacteria bacterium]